MPQRLRLTITVALLAATAVAQNRSGGLSLRGPRVSGRPFAAARRQRSFYPGYAYGAPYFYSDYYEPYEEYAPEAPPPPAPAPAPQIKAEPQPDPVLLELHGNQWVRVNNFGESSKRTLAAATPAIQTAAKPLPPSVLVFRDGHTEEVSSYSIIGQSIYTKANYWTTGAWTRTIPISDLNVPATLKQNQERGLDFALPSGPDEVMIRP